MRRTRSPRHGAAAAAAALLLCTSSGDGAAFAFQQRSLSHGNRGRAARLATTCGDSASVLHQRQLSRPNLSATAAARSDSLQYHAALSSASAHAPLSREEELVLLADAAEYARLKTAAIKSGDDDDNVADEEHREAFNRGLRAREMLVTRNMGLVHYVVNETLRRRRNRLNSLSRDDLLQEGFIGLSRAVDKYDATKSNGAKFSTYAVHWIKAAVLRCIAEKDNVVRVPVGVTEAVSKMTKAADVLGIDLKDGESGEEVRALAAEAGLSANMVREAMRARRRRNGGGYTSFEDWMQTSALSPSDVVSGAGSLDAFAGSGGEDAEGLKSALGEFLQPRELEALSWRYGLLQQVQDEGFRDYEAEAMEELFGTVAPVPDSDSSSATSTMVVEKGARTQLSRSNKKSKATSVRITTKSSELAMETSSSSSLESLPKGGKWGEAMSFAEVGREMAVSAEYGRRLCRRALNKLKKAAEEGRLELRPEWLMV